MNKEKEIIKKLDYFNLWNEIKPKITNKEKALEIFEKIMNDEKIHKTSKEFTEINDLAEGKINIQDLPENSSQFIINQYFQIFKKNADVQVFQQFIIYFKLYSVGRIGHRAFASLVINLFPQQNPKDVVQIRLLPTLMAAIPSLSLGEKQNANMSPNYDYASEIIVGLICSSQDEKARESAIRCLHCLGAGLIDLETAEFWLSHYFHPSLYSKLKEITDFRYLIPSRFPPDMIPDYSYVKPFFSSSDTVLESYAKTIFQEQAMIDLEPVAAEVLESKIIILHNLFSKIHNREEVTKDDLAEFFGDQTEDIASFINKGLAYDEINMLTRKYYEYFNNLTIYYTNYMNKSVDNINDHCFIYNNYLRPISFCYYYTTPGPKEIKFYSFVECEVALAFVNEFINVYFGEETRSRLLDALNILMPLFTFSNENENKLCHQNNQILTFNQIYSNLYLREIAQLINDSGKFDKESDENNLISQIPTRRSLHNSIPEFDKSSIDPDDQFPLLITTIPLRLKSKESMVDIFKNDPKFIKLSHIDLPLTRICKTLNRSSKNGETLSGMVNYLKTKGTVPILKKKFETENTSIMYSVVISTMK